MLTTKLIDCRPLQRKPLSIPKSLKRSTIAIPFTRSLVIVVLVSSLPELISTPAKSSATGTRTYFAIQSTPLPRLRTVKDLLPSN